MAAISKFGQELYRSRVTEPDIILSVALCVLGVISASLIYGVFRVIYRGRSLTDAEVKKG